MDPEMNQNTSINSTNKQVLVTEVYDPELFEQIWEKFVERFVADASSFDFQDIRTAFMEGWSLAIQVLPIMLSEIKNRKETIQELKEKLCGLKDIHITTEGEDI